MVVVLIQGACAFGPPIGPPASSICYSPPKGDSVNGWANYIWFTAPFYFLFATNNSGHLCQNYQVNYFGGNGIYINNANECGSNVHITVKGQSFFSFKIYWQESLLSTPGDALLGFYSDDQCAYLEQNFEFNCPGAPIISQTIAWCYDVTSLDMQFTDSNGITTQIGCISGKPQNIHNDLVRPPF